MLAVTGLSFPEERLSCLILYLVRDVWTVKLSVILPLIVVTDHTVIIRPADPATSDAT